MQCALAVLRLLQVAASIVAATQLLAQCATAHAASAVGQSQLRARQPATGRCKAHVPSSRQVRRMVFCGRPVRPHKHARDDWIYDGACSSMCCMTAWEQHARLSYCLMRSRKYMVVKRPAGCLCVVFTSAVCTGSPEAPAGGSFDCGTGSAPGTVCNGTCSTGGGPITAECQSTGSWTVQGTCAQVQPGGKGCVPGLCVTTCGWLLA